MFMEALCFMNINSLPDMFVVHIFLPDCFLSFILFMVFFITKTFNFIKISLCINGGVGGGGFVSSSPKNYNENFYFTLAHHR